MLVMCSSCLPFLQKISTETAGNKKKRERNRGCAGELNSAATLPGPGEGSGRPHPASGTSRKPERLSDAGLTSVSGGTQQRPQPFFIPCKYGARERCAKLQPSREGRGEERGAALATGPSHTTTTGLLLLYYCLPPSHLLFSLRLISLIAEVDGKGGVKRG